MVKIISGGQVGADIAALRAAKKVGFKTGGWIPEGFKTKGGLKPEYFKMYGLIETVDGGYPTRTRLNVYDGDATLRVASNFQSRGEICTKNAIDFYDKPFYDLPYSEVLAWMDGQHNRTNIIDWFFDNKIEVLNVAGNAIRVYEPPIEAFLTAIFNEIKLRIPVVSV